jgi:hypothetical protein
MFTRATATPRIQIVAGSSVSGLVSPVGDRVLALKNDIAAATQTLRTDQELITATYATRASGNKGIGAQGGATANVAYLVSAWWEGAAAEGVSSLDVVNWLTHLT